MKTTKRKDPGSSLESSNFIEVLLVVDYGDLWLQQKVLQPVKPVAVSDAYAYCTHMTSFTTKDFGIL